MKYKQFEDKYQHPEAKQRKWEKAKSPDYLYLRSDKEKTPKKREWTPEDQAFEDILWAS
jgi:hypothetical protein